MLLRIAAYEVELIDLYLMSDFIKGVGDLIGIDDTPNVDVNKILYAFYHTFQINHIDKITLGRRLLLQMRELLTR